MDKSCPSRCPTSPRMAAHLLFLSEGGASLSRSLPVALVPRPSCPIGTCERRHPTLSTRRWPTPFKAPAGTTPH
jgi:hypothetical protein